MKKRGSPWYPDRRVYGPGLDSSNQVYGPTPSYIPKLPDSLFERPLDAGAHIQRMFQEKFDEQALKERQLVFDFLREELK